MQGFQVSSGCDTAAPAVRIATALGYYWDNVARVADWGDPSWIAASLGVPEAQLSSWRVLLASAPAGVVARCSRALAQALGVAPPELATLSHGIFARSASTGLMYPNAGLLDILPAPLTLRIWRMRALLLRRSEVRRLIDRHTQMQITGWTGFDVNVLLNASNVESANDVARLATVSMPPLASMDAGSLALEGMLLMLRDAKTNMDGLPFPLSRLAVPRSVNMPAWLETLPIQHDEAGTVSLFRLLPELLREWAWLFG